MAKGEKGATQLYDAYLPSCIVERVKAIPKEGKYKYRTRHTYHLVKAIFRRYLVNDILFEDYLELSSKYFEKMLSGRYLDIVAPLLDAKILECNNSYDVDRAIAKKYRFHSEIIEKLGERGIKMELVEAGRLGKSGKEMIGRIEKGRVFDKAVGFLKNLRVNKKAAMQWIEEKILLGKEAVQKLKFNEEIEEGLLMEVSNLAQYESIKREDKDAKYRTTSWALSQAKKKGLDLVQDGRKFYYAERKNYIQQKKIRKGYHYSMIVARMDSKIFYASRGAQNRRLNTNLTNYPKKLIKFISHKSGKLSQLDLANSQFRILAQSITRSSKGKYFHRYCRVTLFQQKDVLDCNGFILSDLKRFVDAASSGKFYEEIEQALSLPSRGEAKQAMFELFFSSWKNNSSQKKKLKAVFPNLVKLVDDYKRRHEDNQFAIALQKIESSIFVDRIYLEKLSAYMVATKHDSIICLTKDLPKVQPIVEKELDRVFGKGNYLLKAEDFTH